MNKAIFLDRDGTICEEVNYLSRPEDLKLYPKAAKAVKMLRASGFMVIVITNQSGIGRGYFSELTLNEIHRKLENDLAEQLTAVDGIYFCPHIAQDTCLCRKPLTGLITNAATDFGIDLAQSWMVGDKLSDVQTGIAAGTKTGLVLTGFGKETAENPELAADIIVDDLFEFARHIV